MNTSKQQVKYELKEDKNPSEYSKYIDQDGVSWSSIESWFFTGVLGGCGCGPSDELGKRAIKVLENFASDDWENRFSVYDNEADEVLAHWMDSKDLIEHGSSISGSWLTEKGKNVFEVIKKYKQ